MEKMMTKLVAILATDIDNGIGKNNTIPWRFKEDLQFFKNTTMGNVIIMGRKTFDSIGRALPGRESIVLTSNRKWIPNDPNVKVFYDVQSILNYVKDKDAFVIGGAEIYRLFTPYITGYVHTRIIRKYNCDTFFDPEEFISSGRAVITTIKDITTTYSNELSCAYQIVSAVITH